MSLTTFDLSAVFTCAVELAEATAAYRPEDHPAILQAQAGADIDPSADERYRWNCALRAIEDAANRLKRALGAMGPLTFAECREQKASPTWNDFKDKFRDANHPAAVRNAFRKLANAAIDLSGYAAVQRPEPALRDRGRRLLAQGLAQLWHGVPQPNRKALRPLLPSTRKAIKWPPARRREPPPYEGPFDIDPSDEYRIYDQSTGFWAMTPGDLDDRQAEMAAGLAAAAGRQQDARDNARSAIAPAVAKRRAGRRRKEEKDSAQLVLAALAAHHQWEPNGSIGNPTPATVRGLAERGADRRTKFSTAAASRFFEKKFPGQGHKGYVAACARGVIGPKLTLWQGEVSDTNGTSQGTNVRGGQPFGLRRAAA